MKGKTEHYQYVSNDISQMSDNMYISRPPAAVPRFVTLVTMHFSGR